jgi:hypothetical protein
MLKDQRELLDAFNAHGVEYVVVGGHAVGAYGEPRLTKDLDILIRGTKENGERVFRALAAYGAPIADYQPSDFFDRPGQVIQFGVPPNRIDILQSISGVPTEDIWRDHTQKLLPGGITANLISLEHLIQNKQAAGRLQDLADVEKLQQYGIED